MTQRVVLATRNQHKVAELRRILESADLDVDLVGTEEFPDLPDVAETGSTFAANALLKANDVAQRTGLIAIADDSGLCVDALNGMPGILSARWAGSTATTPRISSSFSPNSQMSRPTAVVRHSIARPPWRLLKVRSGWWRVCSTAA